jgi:hypothetical protein
MKHEAPASSHRAATAGEGTAKEPTSRTRDNQTQAATRMASNEDSSAPRKGFPAFPRRINCLAKAASFYRIISGA